MWKIKRKKEKKFEKRNCFLSGRMSKKKFKKIWNNGFKQEDIFVSESKVQ